MELALADVYSELKRVQVNEVNAIGVLLDYKDCDKSCPDLDISGNACFRIALGALEKGSDIEECLESFTVEVGDARSARCQPPPLAPRLRGWSAGSEGCR
eukprot:5744235-Alexandrium_andersonii.AAC.1